MLVKEEPNEKISRFKRRENAVSTHESLFACRFGAFFSLFFITRCILVPRSFRPMAFFFFFPPPFPAEKPWKRGYLQYLVTLPTRIFGLYVSEGCNHMTCPQCRVEWCWICVKRWNPECQSSHWFRQWYEAGAQVLLLEICIAKTRRTS